MSRSYFFIDDSGSKDWKTPYSQDFIDHAPTRNDQNIHFWRENYFVLAGVYVPGDILGAINERINKLKIKYFKDRHVEIKSEWLRIPEKRLRKYCQPFGVTDEELTQFTNEWYQVLTDNKDVIQIQAFVLDKRYFKLKRAQYSPLQILTQVLLDRVQLNERAKECIIVFDQMDNEIYSEKHQHGAILKIADKEIDLGSFHKHYTHTRPIFEKSRNTNLLQLADTIAHNVWRQFVHFGDVIDDETTSQKKFYPYFEKIIPNLYSKNGKISGVGIVKVPDPKKSEWLRFDTEN
jgi:hypothetical protein